VVILRSSTLLDSPGIYKIEFNLISLIDRTFKKGVSRKSGPQLKTSIKQQFSSNTFKIQLDKIIDDLYLYTIDFTDKLIKTVLKADFTESHISYFLHAASTNTKGTYLELTEEAVKESTSLASEITDSIIRVLKDEAIYQESNEKLAARVLDLWGGEKYRAERWARTFSADVATNTTLYRYQTSGIEEYQFYATLDKKTSQQCRVLHGTVFKTNSPEAQQYRCPLHFRCRSTLLPVSITTKIPNSLRYENRDFNQPVSQNFKPLEDKLDKDLVKKTLKSIDVFREKYAIPKYILNADTEKRLLKLSVGGNVQPPSTKKTITRATKKKSTLPESKQQKVKIVQQTQNVEFKPLKTTKRVEEWLKQNTKLNYVDFTGVSPEVANRMTESLAYHLNLVPKMKDKIQYFGTIERQLEMDYEHRLKVAINSLVDSGVDRNLAEKFAKTKVQKAVSRVYAHSMNATATKGNFTGVGVGTKYGGDPKKFKAALSKDVAAKWHPMKCDTTKACFDHEFGHVIDDIYGISYNPNIKKLYNSLSEEKMKSSLSGYANTNINEFIAEAWSEYLNNPKPRAVSKEVGDLIMSKIKGDK